MDIATQTHLSTLRNLLTFRLDELRAQVRADELGRRGDADGVRRDVGDRKDEAALEQQGDVLEAEEQRDLADFARVERALKRLDAGTYGDCAACGEPIPLQRLLVQPDAERCAACQTALEHPH